MTGPHDPSTLPVDLPRPEDDGAADHLVGRPLHALSLPSTVGGALDLAMRRGRTIIYCFPRAGRPDIPLPEGWNDIPGARGCTPETTAFRDLHDDIRALHAEVVGISTQAPEDQQEIAGRLRLPFPLLSDGDHRFSESLNLPTFEVEGTVMIRRLTLVVTDGIVDHVFYPVFPPDKAAEEVIVWLLAHPRRPVT